MVLTTTKKMTFIGLMIALGVVLAEYVVIYIPPASPSPLFKMSFEQLPLIITGIIFGPIVGGLTGVATDVIGYFLIGAGKGFVFNFGFTFNAFLGGFIPGMIWYFYSKKNIEKKLVFTNYLFLGLMILSLPFIILNINKIGDVTVNNLTKWSVIIISVLSTFLLIIFQNRYKKSDERYSFSLFLLISLTYFLITSVLLTPLWLFIYDKVAYNLRFIIGLVSYSLKVLVTTFITYLLFKRIGKDDIGTIFQ